MRSAYDILFELVRMGPIIVKNRFFQMPHCNGMGMISPAPSLPCDR